METLEYTIERDETGEIIPLEITYRIFGTHRPETRFEPEEFPELEVMSIVNSDTGEKVELTDAEDEEVKYKAEEHYSSQEEDEEADRGDYLRDCQRDGW